MSGQSVEIKEYFSKVLSAGGWASSRMALPVFVGLGLLVTLCIFFVLQSFIQGLVKDERARMSQDFVEDVVRNVQQLQDPLVILANLISSSDQSSPQAMAATMEETGQKMERFRQVLWFYKNKDSKWIFASVSPQSGDMAQSDRDLVKPDGKMLGALLAGGADKAGQIRIITTLAGLQVAEERQSPKVVSGPVALVRAIDTKAPEKGFIVAVVKPSDLFDERWINDHRQLSFVRIRAVEDNRVAFLFQRDADDDYEQSADKQVYEFPFAGQKWEISSVLMQDQRSRFLELFPFVIMIFGFILAASGAFYIRSNFKQAEVLAALNEVLEQKNYELKSEVGERERLNQALRDAEAANRAVIDSVGDIIFETDRDGQLVFLNQAWEKMTGFEIEQSLGQEIFLMIHPHDQPAQKQEFKNLLKGNKRELRSYTQLRTSDGTFVAVELALSVIQQDERKGLRVVGTLTNIEERRRAERALSEAEKKYRNIVENAAGGIYQLTPEGLFLSSNPALARILGYDSPEQLLREVKNANEFTYLDSAGRTNFYRDLENKESVHNYETQMRRRDGVVIWVNENARAVKDENGQILFIEGSVEDITQRKQSDAAIREAKRNSDMANRAKSEFISNMSHELRTPLNSIIGFSEMIKAEVFGPIGQTTYKEYAADINQSGQKLLRVINEILDISKIEAGERQLNEAVVQINELVDSSLEMLSRENHVQPHDYYEVVRRCAGPDRGRIGAEAGGLESAVQCCEVYA
jgi:PAS domain S-box-containing protein